MPEQTPDTGFEPLFVRNMTESALRIGLLLLLLTLAYDIVRPFINPLIWGAIIAMAAFPLVRWLQPKVGGRRGLAAGLITLFFIAVLAIPAWSIMQVTAGGLKQAAIALEQGELTVPPPAPRVREWPVIGERIFNGWSAASNDMEAFAIANAPQLRELATRLLKQLGGSLLSVFMFLVAVVIAGGFMTYAERCGQFAHRFFIRVGGHQPGGEWARLTVATVRSVLQGVIGVAVIQTCLIALGLFVMAVPAAPLWTTIILIITIAQLPPLIILAPIMLYVFSTTDTTTAVIFTLYQLFAGASDSFLKPLLMGRGLDIPMPIILIGAIGGMIMSGIVGLFAGAVILSIFYKLLMLWLDQPAQQSHS